MDILSAESYMIIYFNVDQSPNRKYLALKKKKMSFMKHHIIR